MKISKNYDYIKRVKNSDGTFDIKESNDLYMELFDISTFKQAIQGSYKIKVR